MNAIATAVAVVCMLLFAVCPLVCVLVDVGGKSLKDDETLASLGLSKGGKLYFRDLGPQVGWTTVSLLMSLSAVAAFTFCLISSFTECSMIRPVLQHKMSGDN